jgi:hypothetical protein
MFVASADCIRWPQSPASAPVSPCRRQRVAVTSGLTGKMIEDRSSPIHSRGQSLDSTDSDVVPYSQADVSGLDYCGGLLLCAMFWVPNFVTRSPAAQPGSRDLLQIV